MGTTKTEKLIFTLLMCTFMVLGMSFYNVILVQGFTAEVVVDGFSLFPIVFLVALILDVFIVGPIAKGLTFKWFNPEVESNKVKIILCISFLMVTMMVLLMSFFGSLLGGTDIDMATAYPQMVVKNFVMVLPLNLLIVAPVARAIHLILFPIPDTEY